MGNIIRGISADKSISVYVADSKDIVAEIENIHKTSAVVTAALGRLSTAAAIMGLMLKGENESVTLRLKGDGPAGGLIAVSDNNANVKSYAVNPVVEIPLNEFGKLDVSGAVGKNGMLSVIKDFNLKEPYIGQSPIVSGEIAEDITYYYAKSEQVPTVCGLGVLVNPDLSVRAAGGYILQLLPFADEKNIEKIEENINNIPPVTQMFDEGIDCKGIMERLLDGFAPSVLETSESQYRCDCGFDKVEKALISLGEKELVEMRKEAAEGKETEVKCHFCNKKYMFGVNALDEILKK